MGDLISRDKLLQKIKAAQDGLASNDDKVWGRNKKYFQGLAWAHRLILDAETVIAEPAKKGRWVSQSDWPQCSRCGYSAEVDEYEYRIRGKARPSETEFCPGCGAKMDGGGADGETAENNG